MKVWFKLDSNQEQPYVMFNLTTSVRLIRTQMIPAAFQQFMRSVENGLVTEICQFFSQAQIK